jgi:hypothetical protein
MLMKLRFKALEAIHLSETEGLLLFGSFLLTRLMGVLL